MNVHVRPQFTALDRHLPFESVALVLQGGGALGAYQAGVYEALAEAGIHPDWVAGVSIGAINGALIAGNPPETRVDKLRAFWEGVTTNPHLDWTAQFLASLAEGDAARQILNQTSALSALIAGAPGFFGLRFPPPLFRPAGSIHATSFYDTGGLATTLERLIDFERINSGVTRLSVGAVNVRTGNFVYFDTATHTIEPRHIMASGALPPGFPAVEIEGEHYWDGGYLGNPAIHPLINECASSDVVIVQINPLHRPDVPVTMRDILNRLNEMTFNASLVREMFGIATVSSLIESGALEDDRYTTVRFHQISAEAELAKYGALSKLNTERAFLEHLHQLGYATAERWIAETFDRIGWESSIDVLEKYV